VPSPAADGTQLQLNSRNPRRHEALGCSRPALNHKIASERLDHRKVGITRDPYSQLLPGMQTEAATRVDALISDALQQPNVEQYQIGSKRRLGASGQAP
jgi:hypothetical protein